jgi:hypothetical protein
MLTLETGGSKGFGPMEPIAENPIPLTVRMLRRRR